MSLAQDGYILLDLTAFGRFCFQCGLIHKWLREIAIARDRAIRREFISPWMQISNTILRRSQF